MNRNISLDLLKLFLAFMVVGIHTRMFYAMPHSLVYYLFHDGIFRVAVPIFLLINGFYFYNTLHKKTFSVWLKRVLLLYLFWMLAYIYFWISEFSGLAGFSENIKTIVIGYLHLWYLPAMIGASFLVFFLKDLSFRASSFLILVSFILGASIQYLGNYHFFANPPLDSIFNKTWVYRNFLFVGFPFFFSGYTLNRFSVIKKISTRQSLFLALFGVLTLLFESYFNFSHLPEIESFDILFSLLFVSIFIFIFTAKTHTKIKEKGKTISFYAAGIYFIHPMIMKGFLSCGYKDGSLLFLLVSIVSVLAAYLLIQLNKRFKFIL